MRSKPEKINSIAVALGDVTIPMTQNPLLKKGSTNKHETCSKGTQGVLKMCPLREFQEKEKRCGSVPKVALSTQKITLIQSVPGA